LAAAIVVCAGVESQRRNDPGGDNEISGGSYFSGDVRDEAGRVWKSVSSQETVLRHRGWFHDESKMLRLAATLRAQQTQEAWYPWCLIVGRDAERDGKSEVARRVRVLAQR
jgi:hypothetical protein